MGQRLGQHFLWDTDILKRIADALDVQPGDTIIEIGPGHGELTDELLKKNPHRLVVIEKDLALATELEKKYAIAQTLSIYRGDVRRALATVVAEHVPHGSTYKVIGNIPYYLTSFLLRLLSELNHKPAITVLTMQEEVAERLSALPPHMNKLAASVRFWSDPEFLMKIPAGAFEPPPDVTSATVRLVSKSALMDARVYFPFIRRLFAQPRKTIANNLYPKGASDADRNKIHAALSSLGLAENARGQELSVEAIVTLAKTLGA